MTLPDDAHLENPQPSRQGQGGGPKTAFGKAASCMNAVTHGLSVRKVQNLPSKLQEEVDERMAVYVARHQPISDDDWALCSLASLSFVQHREAIQEKEVYLSVRSYQAQVTWEVDRIAETAQLGARISKRPEVVAAELNRTYYGALWLLERWKYLARCLETTGIWTEADVSMAYDLLGRDLQVRGQDPQNLGSGGLDVRRAIATKHLEDLEAKINGTFRNLDTILRGMAVNREHYLDEPVFRRLIRLENRALKANRDYIAELERRRIARGLESYEVDGTLCTTPPGPDDLPMEDPPEGYKPIFYQPIKKEPVTESQPQSVTRPIRNEPKEVVKVEPKPRVERPRPELTPEQQQAARQQQAERQKADRRAKNRLRAERKAAKAARKRNR